MAFPPISWVVESKLSGHKSVTPSKNDTFVFFYSGKSHLLRKVSILDTNADERTCPDSIDSTQDIVCDYCNSFSKNP